MRTTLLIPIALATLIAGVTAQGNCTGSFDSSYDDWCQASCNHVPSFCPSAFCTCDDVDPVERLECTARLGFAFVTDDWCNTNCNFQPPFCPESLCDCDQSPTPELFPIDNFEATCCEGDVQYLFAPNGSTILRITDPAGSPSDPEICYELPGGQASDIVFDTDGNMYIADPLAAILYRMSPDCDPTSVEILTSWQRDGIIDRPTGLVIVPDDSSLFISGTRGIYRMTFLANGSVHDIEFMPEFIFNVRSMFYVDGRVFFVNRDAEVQIYDVASGSITTYLAVNELGIPDYGGITINDCGLFFTATDLNQIFFCPDITDSSSCRLQCVLWDIDSVTCENIINPFDIESGCCCDVYVASAVTGCIVRVPNTSDGLIPPPAVAENVICDLDFPLTVGFYSQRTTTGPCIDICELTPTASPSPSPTISDFPPAPTQQSASPSLTSSASPSASPSASSSASSSSSASTSASRTASVSSTTSPSPSTSPTPSLTRRLGRLVPGVNLPASGGFQQAGVLTGTAEAILFVCEVGQPLFLCEPNPQSTNEYRIPTNKLDIVSLPGDDFQAVRFPSFIQALSKPGTGSTGPFAPSCLFHVSQIHRSGDDQVVCDDSCFNDHNIGFPRLRFECDDPQFLSVQDSQNRARSGINRSAQHLGLAFDAFGDENGVENVPQDLFESVTTPLCDNDVVAEFSISLLQLSTGSPVVVTIASQPRFSPADRCNPEFEQAPRLCFNVEPFVNSVFGGVVVGDENGYVCIEEFLVDGSPQSTGGYQTADSILQLVVGDILDLDFFVSTRSSGCPPNFPSELCAASTHRLCHVDECSFNG